MRDRLEDCKKRCPEMVHPNRLWYFRVRGYFYPIGPIEAPSQTAARRKANRMGFKAVTEVWETSRKEMDLIVRLNKESFRGITGVEAIMLADM